MQQLQNQTVPVHRVQAADSNEEALVHRVQCIKKSPQPVCSAGDIPKQYYLCIARERKFSGQVFNRYRCFSCSKSGHQRGQFWFCKYVCNKCSIKGHIASTCNMKNIHNAWVEDNKIQDALQLQEPIHIVNSVLTVTTANAPINVSLRHEKNDVIMQLDTCDISITP